MAIKRSTKIFAACFGMLFTATIASSDFIIDNFDDGNGESELNSYWYFYTDAGDGGTSTVNGQSEDITFDGPYEVGKDGTNGVKMEFALGDSFNVDVKPYAVFETEFVKGGVIDFSGVEAVQFDVKSSVAAGMSLKFVVNTKAVTDYNHYCYVVKNITTEWKTVKVLFTKDPDLGLAQEKGWGKAVKFDSTQIQRFGFSVRKNENPTLKSGTLYIDNIVLIGNPKIKKFDEITPVAVGSYTGKGLVSKFGDEENPTETYLGTYWYLYQDAGTSHFTKGVDADNALTVDKTGGQSGPGLAMTYELGAKVDDNGTMIDPYVGVGVNLKAFDAAKAGATGIYIEYKSTPSKAGLFVDMEVEDSKTREAGVAWHVKLPSTGTEWKGAKVPFDSLKVPKWATSPAALDLTTLKKVNFKISDAAIKEGTFSIDKLFFMNASISGVLPHSSKFVNNNITIKQIGNVINFSFNGKSALDVTTVSLINTMGKVLTEKHVSKEMNTCTLPLGNNASGVYLLKISSVNGAVETLPVHVAR
jgi:hypothetical protein